MIYNGTIITRLLGFVQRYENGDILIYLNVTGTISIKWCAKTKQWLLITNGVTVSAITPTTKDYTIGDLAGNRCGISTSFFRDSGLSFEEVVNLYAKNIRCRLPYITLVKLGEGTAEVSRQWQYKLEKPVVVKKPRKKRVTKAKK